jgi:hypothetical protein
MAGPLFGCALSPEAWITKKSNPNRVNARASSPAFQAGLAQNGRCLASLEGFDLLNLYHLGSPHCDCDTTTCRSEWQVEFFGDEILRLSV